MVDLDVEYIEKQSFWLDIKILILTIPVAFSQKGAG
jgi:lipopolysaccharide/colanic/teichoic acid biosynthesis glycosyltransferase